MENSVQISIVMPVYNAEKYVDKAVESVLKQTLEKIELIIVDDQSTDKSGEICDKWAEKDSRVKVYHLQENVGAGCARNYGIKQSKGEYLTFVDSDDKIETDLYTRVLGKPTAPYDVYVWGVTEQYCDKEGKVTSQNVLFLEDEILTDETAVRKKIIELEEKTLFGYQWNHLYRTEIVKKNNIEFRKYHLYEDYFFNLEYIEYAKSMKISSCVGYYYYKRMNQSLTRQYVSSYFELSKKRVASLVKAYKRWGLYDEKIKTICGNRYMRYCFSAIMRNNAREAEMTHRDKRKWVQKLRKESFYNHVVKRTRIENKSLAVVQMMINLGFIEGCLLLGKGVFIVKEVLPGLYTRKGLIH